MRGKPAVLVASLLLIGWSAVRARPIQDGGKERGDTLIGYKEQVRDAAAGSKAAGGDIHPPDKRGVNPEERQEAAAGGQAVNKEASLERVVALHTQFGTLPIRLLPDLAPKTASMVWELALQRGCHSCAFYRWGRGGKRVLGQRNE